MMKGANFQFTATNKAGPAMRGVSNGLRSVRRQTHRLNTTNKSFMKGMSANRRLVQQVGMQVSDLGVQIAGGQSALLSLTQQVPQVVQMFGAWGGVLAALITILGTLSIVLIKSGKGISDIIPIMGVLREEFTALTRIISATKEIMIDAANVIVNNLDTIFIAASLVGGYFAGKWVSSFVLARVATNVFGISAVVASRAIQILGVRGFAAVLMTRTWTAALGVLRAGLLATVINIRVLGVVATARIAAAAVVTNAWSLAVGVLSTAFRILRGILATLGIPALIIGASYLIERFLRLVQVTGSMGEAMDILREVAAEVFERIPFLVSAAVAKIQSRWYEMLATFQLTMADLIDSVSTSMASVIGAFIGAYNVVVAAWDMLPDAFKRIGALAINSLIETFSSGVGALLAPVNAILERVGQTPIPTPDLSGWKVEVPAAVNAAGAYVDAFNQGMVQGTSIVNDMSNGLRQMAAESQVAANATGQLGDHLMDAATRPMTAWQRLRNLIRETQFDVRDWFGGGAGDGGGGGGGGGGSGKGPAAALKKEADLIKKTFMDMKDTISSSMLSSFKAVLKGTKSLGEAAMDLLGKIIDKVIDLLMTPIFDSIAGGLAGGILGGLGKLGAKAPGIPSLEGGGFTGHGARAGGLDGRGGQLAMLHPGETVTDHRKGGGGGGGDTYVTMNITTPDADSFRKSRRQIEREARQMVG